MDKSIVSSTPKNKQKNFQDKAEYLEDISTLTSEYIESRFKTYLFDTGENLPISGNIMPLLAVLEAINQPSEGKRYIISHGTKFLFKQGTEVLSYKNIDPILFPIVTYSPHIIANRIRYITLKHDLGEAELIMIKNKVDMLRSIIKMMGSLKSRLFSTFKSRLSTPFVQ